MTRRANSLIVVLAVAMLGCTAVAESDPVESFEGTWTSRLGLTGERVTFDLRFPDGGETSWSVDLDRLDGLTRDDLKTTGTPLQFDWRTGSGRIAFEGHGRWFGRPAGTFRVEPAAELVEVLGGTPTAESAGTWWRIVMTGIDPDMIRALDDAGLDPPTASELSRLAAHGVTSAEVGSFVRLEPVPSVDDLIHLHRHGVAATDVDRLVDVGLARVSARDLTLLRRNGLSGDDVAAYRAVPGRDVDIDAIIRLRRNGIDPGVLAGMTPTGGRIPTVDEVVGMVRHGVSAERYRGFLALGHDDVDDIVDLVRNGVDPEWIASLLDAGVEPIAADDLVRLRRHGVDASLVRRVVDAGATDLGPDALIDAAVRGVDAVR